MKNNAFSDDHEHDTETPLKTQSLIAGQIIKRSRCHGIKPSMPQLFLTSRRFRLAAKRRRKVVARRLQRQQHNKRDNSVPDTVPSETFLTWHLVRETIREQMASDRGSRSEDKKSSNPPSSSNFETESTPSETPTSTARAGNALTPYHKDFRKDELGPRGKQIYPSCLNGSLTLNIYRHRFRASSGSASAYSFRCRTPRF